MITVLSVGSSEKAPVLLTLLSEADGGTERLLCPLFEKEYQSLGSPAAGTVLSEEEETLLLSLWEEHKAKEAALRLLSFGDNNANGLFRKLRGRGFSSAAAESAVSQMVGRGYIRERDQLYRLVRSLANGKLFGEERIRQHLITAGYRREDVANAIAEAVSSGDVDFIENRKKLLKKKLPEGAAPQKAAALLYRYGYRR